MEQNSSSHIELEDVLGAGVVSGPLAAIVDVRNVIVVIGAHDDALDVDEGSTRVVPWGGTH